MNEYVDKCTIHETVYIPDNPVPLSSKNPNRARETIPPGWLNISSSKIYNGGEGVWALKKIKLGLRFGPYEGTSDGVETDGEYSWQIERDGKVMCYIDGQDTCKANWMRFVNCARNKIEQNLMAYQYRGKIYYRAIVDISPGTELLVFYGPQFARELGIDTKNFNSPPEQPLKDNIFKCEKCHLAFSNPIYLENHVGRCSNKKNSTTDKKVVKRIRNDNTSTDNNNNNESYKCHLCTMIYTIKSLYDRHLKVKHYIYNINQEKTTDDNSTSNDSGYNGEPGNQVTNRKYKCSECHRPFTHASNLKKHSRVHTGERPFKCQTCQKTFNQAINLKQHQLTHTGVRAHECDVCHKTFNQKVFIMDNLSGKDFLKTLKCLDIETGPLTDESLDWLFDKKDERAILTWLCTYLNENNVEMCNEIQEYTALENEGRDLSEEYIENTCKSNPIFDEVLNTNMSQIISVRRELGNEKTQENNLKSLTNKYLCLEGKLNRNIEDEEMNLRIKRKSYLTKCVAYGKQVDELHNNFYKRIEKFSNILCSYNMGREKYFISQMPLHTYKQQSDIFQTNLHLWMRKNFEITNFSHASEDIDNIDNELNRLYFKIGECILKRVQAECNQKELTSKLSYFRNNSYTEMTEEQRRVQIIQFTSRINILYDDRETLYVNDLQQAAEKFTENLVNTVIIKNAENKLRKIKDIVETLKNVNDEIIQELAQYKFLFLLLKTDKIKLRNIDKFLEDLYFYSSNYLKNYSLKSKLMNEVENNAVKEYTFKEIISILTERYNDEHINIRSTISEVEKQKVSIDHLENDLFVIRNQKYLSQVKQLEQIVTNGKKYVWCGPTLQPVITPYEFLDNLNIANCQIEKVKTVLKTSMDNLNQLRTTIKKNTWETHRRLLWVWFLIKPEKITTIIEQLRDYVTEQARSNT